LAKTPFYVVGPATFRSLSSIPGVPPTQIFGAHTGNGEALAHFILSHYTALYPGEEKPPLLFLVGEQRRDIIPKILGANGIIVDELIVYETAIMESFEESFKITLSETEKTVPGGLRWVTVFSPTGCEAMLRSLHLLDPEERAQMTGRSRTAVATIGPTTRDFLLDKFGFEPDVCAASPSAEGLGDGITRFLEKSGPPEGPSGSS
jgi:uroporphyrinogen-III synthase